MKVHKNVIMLLIVQTLKYVCVLYENDRMLARRGVEIIQYSK